MKFYNIFFTVISVALLGRIHGQFSVPNVHLEAFEPTGLRVSMKAQPGIQMFGFHGKINKEFIGIEPGDISADIRSPDVDNFFRFFDPDVKLNVGDKVYYWIFVQHNNLGYRKSKQSWLVDKILSNCEKSTTQMTGENNVCSGQTILEDNFDTIDTKKWTVEHYIPDRPDFEFVIYQNKPEQVSTWDNKLTITPTLITDNEKLLAPFIDLTSGCTKDVSLLCYRMKHIFNNPIYSGRIVSKQSFAYGEVEIKAKLPRGDWIFPEIYLEEDHAESDPIRIFIAYARGNKNLVGNDGDDLGGSLLFGGPSLSPGEPDRSKYLSSYRNQEGPLSDDFHIYKLKWTPDLIELSLDDNNYGRIEADKIRNDKISGSSPNQFRLVLGVGVGGINDFPNDYKSGDHEKPWINAGRKQVKDFYLKKDEWYGTWDSGRRLLVDYVKIRAV